MKCNLGVLALVVFAMGQEFTLNHAFGQDKEIMTIHGTVVDASDGKPIGGAVVRAHIDDFSVQTTNDSGEFKFIVRAPEEVEIEILKQGYRTDERVLRRNTDLRLDVALQPVSERPRIEGVEFRSGEFISGRVENLRSEETENHKILVYVLTDKWYIHPYAENAEARGYASIGDSGEWRIQTVWRGYQAYRLAILLAEKGIRPPPVVSVYTLEPDKELLSAVPTVASYIEDAPPGV